MTSNTLIKDSLLERDDCLLVVIDVQERLMPPMSHRDAVVDNAKRLIAFSNIIDLPIIVTEQDKLGPTVVNLSQQKRAVTLIPKVTFNCFDSDRFSEAVQQSGRKTLILLGVEAHICVAQTALHALSDFNVHVVRDAISSRTVDNWNTAIDRMRAAGVTITSTEMVIYELLKRAGTEEFKAALALVK